jgi:CDP-diacylglycerol--glycerol-3-phosphate 3-phosphatidyltransferase
MATASPTRDRPALANLPNQLTAARLVLAVVLFGCVAAEWWLAGLVVFVLAAVTDWLDGYLARRLGVTGAFGRQFDPLVDKVLVCGAFIFLLPVDGAGLAPWMVTLVVARELLITGLRGFVESQATRFGADWLGKLKMGLQCAALIAILFVLHLRGGEPGGLSPWVEALGGVQAGLTYAMLAATALSGVQYLWRAAVLLREG